MYVKSISRRHRQAINKFKTKVAFDMNFKLQSEKERKNNERKN